MKGLTKILERIEASAIRKNQWFLIPNSDIQLFYVDIFVYKGKERALSDGTIIRKGDVVGEFHMNNHLVPEVTFRNILKFEKQIDSEMRTLARSFEQENLVPVKAFFARTVLYPIVKRLDFELFQVDGFFFRMFLSLWDYIIMLGYSKSKKKPKLHITKEVWISKEKMTERLDR